MKSGLRGLALRLHRVELDGQLARKLGIKREQSPTYRPRNQAGVLTDAWRRGWDSVDRELAIEEWSSEVGTTMKTTGTLKIPPGTPFAATLTLVRESRGLTQNDLATATGLKPSAINHFEKGRRTPHIRNLILLADALNTSADVLLGRVKQGRPLCD